MLHVKTNDQVLVLAGKDRGKTGRVLQVLPGGKRAVIERINMIYRHTRQNPQQNVQGGILEKEAPVALSNLQVICRECNRATRVGFTRLSDGKKVRTCKKCGGTIDK